MNIKKFMALFTALVCIMQVNTFADDGGAADGEAMLTQKELVKISTEADLRDFAAKVNAGDDFSDKYVRLENDITLDSSVNWTPIGNAEATPFCGTFYGGDHTISNLTQNDESVMFYGLFGYVKNGSVQNVKLNNVNISMNGVCSVDGNDMPSYIGGIAGGVENGSVLYCNVLSGYVSVKKIMPTPYYGYLGGVVGFAYKSDIKCCSNAANINSYVFSGGITRENYQGTIEYCYNDGLIRTWSTSAEAAGLVYQNMGTISYCYNSGKLETLGNSAGMLVNNAKGARIEHCADFNKNNYQYTVNNGDLYMCRYIINSKREYVITNGEGSSCSLIGALNSAEPKSLMSMLNYYEENLALAVDCEHPVFWWEALYNNGKRLRGDMNGDGHFSPKDASFMLKNLTGTQPAENNELVDFDANGSVDMKDVVKLMSSKRYSFVYDEQGGS